MSNRSQLLAKRAEILAQLSAVEHAIHEEGLDFEDDFLEEDDDVGADFPPDRRFEGIPRNWMGEPC